MKGIAAIIATILLLLITIALAGTAYVFIQGIITPKVEQVIELTSVTCSSANKITLVISNVGTEDVTLDAVEAVGSPSDFLVDGTPTTCGAADLTIAAKEAGACTITSTAGTHTIVIVGPANAPTAQVYC